MDHLKEWADRIQKRESNIQVTDGVIVRFAAKKRSASFQLDIVNDQDRGIEIQRVRVNPESIIARNDDVDGIVIRPDRDFTLFFDVVRSFNKVDAIGRVQIQFKNSSTVTRLIKIIYDESAFLRKHTHYQKYPIPRQFGNIIYSKKSYDEQMEAFDAIIPTSQDLNFDNYSRYFHGLLYLEEIGLQRRFDIYTRHQVHFWRSNNYYEMDMEDLFETRPALKVGDTVVARKNNMPQIEFEGRVVALEENQVIIEFGRDFESSIDDSDYEVEFHPNTMDFTHGHRAIDLACNMFDSEYLFPNRLKLVQSSQLDVYLSDSDIVFCTKLKLRDTDESLPWFNGELNMFQRSAVQRILRAECPTMPYIIYGPPGTGKTTTLTEVILQLNRNVENSRILVTARSNSAANLLAQRLIYWGDLVPSELLRLTSLSYTKTDQMPDDLIEYSARFHINRSSQVDDIVDDSSLKIRKIDNVEDLKEYRIVIGTTASMSALVECPLIDFSYSHVIIDEAAQCTEVDALIPMLMAGKDGQIVMAGDPKQMPPIIFDDSARDRGLAKSLMCRLLERYWQMEINDNYLTFDITEHYSSKLVTKLILNYRSLPCILNFVNERFYNSELVATLSAASSREAKTLDFAMAENIVPRNDNNHGIYFFNVNGTNSKLGKTSWCNQAEARQIGDMVIKLTESGISDQDIGVISPYHLQVRMIKYALCEQMGLDVTVGTVEEFQGKERPIILLSTVRTCKENARLDVSRYLGFICCPKRLNVAASRARALFVVLGKAKLLTMDDNWKALIDQCKANDTFIET